MGPRCRLRQAQRAASPKSRQRERNPYRDRNPGASAPREQRWRRGQRDRQQAETVDTDGRGRLEHRRDIAPDRADGIPRKAGEGDPAYHLENGPADGEGRDARPPGTTTHRAKTPASAG